MQCTSSEDTDLLPCFWIKDGFHQVVDHGKDGGSWGKTHQIIPSGLEVQSDKPSLEEWLVPFTTKINFSLSG